MCGPTTQEETIAGQQESFGQTLQGNYNQNFGNQSAILGNLTSILKPIAQAGPNQTGFSAAEKASMDTQALDTTGANYSSAARALNGATAGRGVPGGPQSGVDQQLDESLASNSAGTLSQEEGAITQADYATGRANFNNAVSGLGQVAGQYNPNATASVANNANEGAFSEAQSIEQQQAQEDADIAGGVEAVAGAAAGGIGGGMAGMSASPAGASQPGAFAQGFLQSL